jgi:peroxiredoxin
MRLGIMTLAFMLLSANAFAAGLKVGAQAPDFSLQGADGKTYKLSQFKGKNTVILEWFNKDCPYVRKFYDSKVMPELQAKRKAKGDVWLTIASSAAGKEGHLDTPATAEKVVTSMGLASSALLLDKDGKVGKLYAAKTTPQMFIVDKAGKLVYQGAIDDRPSATKASLTGATNYVTAALDSMEKSEPIKNSATSPYGCSVKY